MLSELWPSRVRPIRRHKSSYHTPFYLWLTLSGVLLCSLGAIVTQRTTAFAKAASPTWCYAPVTTLNVQSLPNQGPVSGVLTATVPLGNGVGNLPITITVSSTGGLQASVAGLNGTVPGSVCPGAGATYIASSSTFGGSMTYNDTQNLPVTCQLSGVDLSIGSGSGSGAYMTPGIPVPLLGTIPQPSQVAAGQSRLDLQLKCVDSNVRPAITARYGLWNDNAGSGGNSIPTPELDSAELITLGLAPIVLAVVWRRRR